MDRVNCTHCGLDFESNYKSTLLGFKEYTCPDCKRLFLGTLRTSHLVLYWALLLGFGAAAIAALVAGQLPLPGLLTILSIYALSRNASIKESARQKRSIGVDEDRIDSDAPTHPRRLTDREATSNKRSKPIPEHTATTSPKSYTVRLDAYEELRETLFGFLVAFGIWWPILGYMSATNIIRDCSVGVLALVAATLIWKHGSSQRRKQANDYAKT